MDVIKINTLLSLDFAGLPPSVNQMYRTSRGSARYKKPEVSEWQEEIAAVMRKAWGGKKPYADVVEVRVLFTVANDRRWDVDNRLKALLDCLAYGGVIHDDSQIWGIVAARVKGDTNTTKITMKKYSGLAKKS